MSHAGTEAEVVTGGEELAASLGITYRKLDYWTRLNHIRPVDAEPGTGVPREWPPAELEIARRMGRLTDAGIAVEVAAPFARDSWPRGEIAPGIALVITEPEEHA